MASATTTSTSFHSLSSVSFHRRTSFARSRPSSVSFQRSPAVRAAANTTIATSSFYELLGIEDGATCQEIKAAYRRLARVLHPDVAAASNGDKDAPLAAGEFIRVHEAYAILSDPHKRADYDRMMLFKRRRVGYTPNHAVSTTKNGTSSYSGFSGYTRRTWETDQCW